MALGVGTVRNLLSRTLVKRSLASHGWLGLFSGALLYLICLSGAVVVFSHFLMRWEQPAVPEFEQMPAASLDRAYRDMLAAAPDISGDALLMLPQRDAPRSYAVSTAGAWFLNEDGSRAGDIDRPWSDMLTDLHLHLHLPHKVGLVLVSSFGAILCALILSGFLSHPGLIRDAFRWRRGGSLRLEQVDLHNRLGVWATPFHLMIGVTGAYFGIAALMTTLIAGVFFGGDRDAAIAAIHGAPPALEQPIAPAAVGSALHRLAEVAPAAEPFYIAIEDVNTPEQYIIIGGRHHDRLIYGEQYRFDTSGNYLGKAGYTDGPAGQQAIFATYRLHFGQFGGVGVLFLYAGLGLALSVVAVSGVNVWLHRRKNRDALNNVWVAIVWGAPLAMAVPALGSVASVLNPTALFWFVMMGSMALAQRVDDPQRSRRFLQRLTAAVLVVAVALHVWRFGVYAIAAPAVLGVNVTLLMLALLLAFPARRGEPLNQACPV